MTNIATPYRLPVWQHLAKQTDLTVALLAETEPNRFWSFNGVEVGINLVCMQSKVIRRGNLSLYWPTRELMKLLGGKFDVLILGGWESPAYIYAALVARMRGIRIVSHYGSIRTTHRHSRGLIAKLRAWFYRQLDAHVTYGNSATESLVSMGVDSRRIYTGFNAVNHKSLQDEVVQNRRPPRGEGHTFIFVGRLIALKNVAQSLEAFALIRQDHDEFRIVGSGPEESKLRALADKLKLGSSVVFVGHMSSVPLITEYANANTLVLASTNEVWGLVVNEALASGLHAIVSSNCGVVPDVKHMAGVYICNTDSESLAHAMILSRESWRGYIHSPDILKFTQVMYANQFVAAVNEDCRSTRSVAL